MSGSTDLSVKSGAHRLGTEIILERTFSAEESSLIDMHSVLNVLNVIIYELMLLDDHIGPSPELEKLHELTVDVARALSNSEAAFKQVAQVADYICKVERGLFSAAQAQGNEKNLFFLNHLENIRSVFSILEVRAKEIVSRESDPLGWVDHDVSQLKESFINVFRAIERNSYGGYKIVYNLAQHEEADYLILFDITSEAGQTIRMPVIFQDVMRDLLANARKYTLPGGTIQAGLYHSGKELRFVVSDTGCGIPEEEILKVVEFGVRGSNVMDRVTRGGGFGLTKAYHVTKLFGGRMWIYSKGLRGHGTRVEIRIPCLEPLANSSAAGTSALAETDY